MKKYQSRKEQRNVTETMNALLLPLLPYLTSDTAIIVKRALYLLGEIEVEPVSKETEESILAKILSEVLEYIDDIDIAAEIGDIFDKYMSESEGKK